MTERKLVTLADGLRFPESPRWRDGRLWFSDMFARRVMVVDIDGHTDVVAQLDDEPSGLGFLADGTPLVVLMNRRQLVWLDSHGKPHVFADLSHVAGSFLNDMVVTSDGRAYVDSIVDNGAVGTDKIILVEPDGRDRVAADSERFELMERPNGLIITPDQKTLIFATTAKQRLAAMNIDADGSLSSPCVFADTPGAAPDGICLDAEGAVWAGGLESNQFLRLERGGRALESISVNDRLAVACVLGGPDRRTLFLLSAIGQRGHLREASAGFIDMATVEVPGAGWP